MVEPPPALESWNADSAPGDTHVTEARQVLIPVLPFLAGDDQAYHVVDLETTDERLCDKPAG
jgi:hypothetical protein